MSTPPQVITHRLAAFAQYLREHGFSLGPHEQVAMLHSLSSLPSMHLPTAQAAWRAIACGNARQWKLWPDLFKQFWFPHRIKGTVKVTGQPRVRKDLRAMVQALQQGADSQGEAPTPSSSSHSGDAPSRVVDAPVSHKAQGGASLVDALHDRSASTWMPQDLHTLNKLARQIHHQLKPQATRRWQSHPDGARLNIRNTLRHSLGWGGEPHPMWSRRKTLPPRLFLLADVSKSMESHANFYLRMCRAFVQNASARAFVFHVHLSEVTPLLLRDSPQVQEKINAVTAGFGSGTRIAHNLQRFVQLTRSQIRRPAHVWVLSDGYDTDPPESLAHVLQHIKGLGAQVTWFYPTRKAPASQAFTQALPHIHRHMAVAQLADLLRFHPTSHTLRSPA